MILTVKSPHEIRTIALTPGQTLFEALAGADLHGLHAPCGGRGHCLHCTCLVTGPVRDAQGGVVTHHTPAPVLACRTILAGDCTLYWQPEEEVSVWQDLLPEAVPINRPPRPDWTQPGRLGLAVDIGTTTLAAYLYDLETGCFLCRTGEANAQRLYGGDVIARMQWAMERPSGQADLTCALQTQLLSIAKRLCVQSGRPFFHLSDVVLAGNTVMLHMAAGLPTATLAVSPFTPVNLFGQDTPADGLWPDWPPGCHVYCAPAISAYIGGDITAGLLSLRAMTAEKPVLLADIGTNGEMALCHNGRVYCCAAAAGPAFEGGEIACGLPGVPGAIDRVWIRDGKIAFTTIAGRPARGLCGSGLLDLLAALCRLGIVDETGSFVDDARDPALRETDGHLRYHITDSLSLSQADIRKLQLAKGAIFAGLVTLLHEAGLEEGQIAALYLAGGFGNFLRPDSAAQLGLFPPALRPVVHGVGNTAGKGAQLLLLSDDARQSVQDLANRCRLVELSTHPVFHEAFMDGMAFDPCP